MEEPYSVPQRPSTSIPKLPHNIPLSWPAEEVLNSGGLDTHDVDNEEETDSDDSDKNGENQLEIDQSMAPVTPTAPSASEDVVMHSAASDNGIDTLMGETDTPQLPNHSPEQVSLAQALGIHPGYIQPAHH